MSLASNPVRFSLALLPAVVLFSCGASLWHPSAQAWAVGTPPAGSPGRPQGSAPHVVKAIERAVIDRMGPDVSVSVIVLRTDVTSERTLAALADPGARTGQPVRFVLTAAAARKGMAIATVQVHARYARATRAIARDETLTAAAVEVVTGELPDVAFRRLPAADDIVGLRARRAIAPGEPLTAAVLDVPPVVQSGDEVTVRVAIGGVEATGVAIASGSGHVGDTIRIISPASRRALKARIIGRGAVEVLE